MKSFELGTDGWKPNTLSTRILMHMKTVSEGACRPRMLYIFSTLDSRRHDVDSIRPYAHVELRAEEETTTKLTWHVVHHSTCLSS